MSRQFARDLVPGMSATPYVNDGFYLQGLSQQFSLMCELEVVAYDRYADL